MHRQIWDQLMHMYFGLHTDIDNKMRVRYLQQQRFNIFGDCLRRTTNGARCYCILCYFVFLCKYVWTGGTIWIIFCFRDSLKREKSSSHIPFILIGFPVEMQPRFENSFCNYNVLVAFHLFDWFTLQTHSISYRINVIEIFHASHYIIHNQMGKNPKSIQKYRKIGKSYFKYMNNS